MPSKYTTILDCDTGKHNEKIQKSASEIYKYKRAVNQADAEDKKWISGMKGNIGTVAKFLGTIGLATGSLDIFSKSIRHNQATSDALDQVQAALNTTVNNFYHSLSSGDFTYFTNGLSSIISKAKEAQIAIDQLGNTMMSYSIINARAQNKMAKARAIYYDPKSTKEQKEQAKRDMAAATKELGDATKVQIQDIGKVVRTTVARDTNINSGFITDDMINRALEVNATQGRDAYKKVIETQYSTYQKELKNVQKKYTKYNRDSLGNSHPYITDTAAYNKELQKLNKTYSGSIVGHVLLSKYTDDELNNLTQLTVSAYNLDTQLQSLSATEDRLNNRAFKPGGSGTKTNTKTNTPTPAVNVPTFTFGGLAEEIEYLKKRNEYIEKGTALWDEYRAKSTSLMGNTDANNKALEDSLKLHQDIIDNIEVENQWTKLTNGAQKYGEAIGEIGSAFSSLGRGFELPEFDVMGTIAQSIANIALSFSQAMLKPKDPFTWIAFAAAGLSTMIGMIATIKSSTEGFATGGIVGGSTTVGDYNLIRANKGEMILNNREQSRLFNVLSSSGSYSQASGLDSNNVNFRISGADLVGVLNNVNKKRSKVI